MPLKTTTARLARFRPTDGDFRLATYGLFGCLLIVMGTTFQDYGLGWDEEVQRIYGDRVMRWYATLGQDRSALTYLNLRLYGALFEVVAHVLGPLLPLGLYEGRHPVAALFGLLALVTTYRLGVFLAGPPGGFFSALFLAVTPGFYGHLFHNPKDIPFAALYLVSLYAILLTYDSLPRVPIRRLIGAGVAIGLTLGTRIGGIVLLALLVLLWAAWLLIQWKQTPRGTGGGVWLATVDALLDRLGLVTMLAWAVMLVFWPWAQTSPFANPLSALQLSLRFEDWANSLVFFDGTTYLASDLPRSYLPTWLAISLPEFYFVALATGGLLGMNALFTSNTERLNRLAKISVVVIAAGLPLVMAVVSRPILYDGMRHFLFIVPPFAVLAGVSVAALLRAQTRLWPIANTVMAVVLLSVGLTAIDMARLHPYEYVYFNRAVAGGERAGAARFETDYWGLSYKEAVDWVVDDYQPRSEALTRVANCSAPFQTQYFLDKSDGGRRFVNVRPNEAPQIFLTTTRFSCDKLNPGRILHTVERVGVPLAYVVELPR